MAKWTYIERHADGVKEITKTEEEIFSEYFDTWKAEMEKDPAGAEVLQRLSEDALKKICLADWTTLHWAYRVSHE